MEIHLLLALLLQDRPLQVSEDVEIRTRIRAWHPWVEGGAKGEEDNPILAFDDDLDLDSPGWIPAIEIGLYAPERRDPSGRGVAISVWSFATSGEERLEGDEMFEGSAFPAGSTIRSRLRFLTFGIDGTLAGDRRAAEPFSWSFAVGLHYLEAELHVSGAAGEESEEYGDANLKFTFAGEGRPFPWFFVAGSVAFYTDIFSLLLGVDSGHYGVDVEVSTGLDIAPLRLEFGLRLFAWTLNWWESEIDLVVGGPFAGLTLRF